MELGTVLGVVLTLLLLILCITTVLIVLFALKRRTSKWLTQLFLEVLSVIRVQVLIYVHTY